MARYLSYGEWSCGHEEARHMRNLDDVRAWLSQPCTGTAETSIAPWWRLLQKFAPDARVLVVRRPVGEILESLSRVCSFDAPTMVAGLRRLDAKLDQIEARLSNVLSVRYADLSNEETCQKVFEHCLPYKHVHGWWALLDEANIQVSMGSLIRYAEAFRPQMAKLAKMATHAIRADLALRKVTAPDGISFQQESFDHWFRDAQGLIAEHLVQVDEAPDNATKKNLALMKTLDDMGNMQIVTARSNGRMFGYLMTVLSPSLESPGLKSSIHTTFFASKEYPGLGMKLQREALIGLKERGIDEVFMRAGPRGSGPKMGALYQRLGADPDGELFRLNLKGH
jgi:hypothetical protein